MTDVLPAVSDQVRGLFVERLDDCMIVLAIVSTNYRLHLSVDDGFAGELNKHVIAVLHAVARRVDVVHTGGRYIEPVIGRPRRVQGRVLAVDEAANTITVRSACPFVAHLSVGQTADAFEPGQLVSFDVERGTSLKPGQTKP